MTPQYCEWVTELAKDCKQICNTL